MIAILLSLSVLASAAMGAGSPQPDAADSARVLREARRAQARFEAARRGRLPVRAGGGSSPCDVRIGRFCYWHDDGEAEPPAEPASIARERRALVARLDSAARQIAGDAWVAGQRVRYHAEAGDTAAARRAAEECRAEAWWCAALAGYASHRAGHVTSAESHFARARAAMSADARCAWDDVGDLLDDAGRARWRDTPCAARDTLAARVWLLATPFLSRAGHDARAEHDARRTLARIEGMASSGYDIRWGDDTAEMLLRYGWPVAWSKVAVSAAGIPGTSIVGHDASPSFAWMPSGRLLATPLAAVRDAQWALRDRAAPARYAPAYVKSLHAMEMQLARFRRGDSLLLVAAAHAESDSLVGGDSLVAALAAADVHGPHPRVARRTGLAGALALTVPARDHLVAVELFDPARRAAARWRTGVAPLADSGRLAVSDLLVYDAVGGLPRALQEALPHVRGTTTVRGGERVGVLWETYGLSRDGETVAVTLTIERVGDGWATRAAQRVGLAQRLEPVHVRWSEVPDPASGGALRALPLHLTALPAGRYRVHVEVRAANGARASSIRDIAVRR